MNADLLLAPSARSDWSAGVHILRSVGVGVAVALASAVGFDAVSGPSRIGRVLPLLLVAGVVLAGMAFVRFEAFVLVVLATRASVDYVRLGSSVPVEPSVVVSVAFVLASLVWLAAQRRAGEAAEPRRPLTRVALVFLGTALLSTTTSIDPVASTTELARLASVVMMIVILERLCRTPKVMRRVLMAVFASAVVPALVGLQQSLGGAGRAVIDGYSRVTATFTHPNSFAMYLAFLVVMGVALVPQVRWRWRWPALAALALGGTLLLLTFSRGAWIAAGVGLIAVGALHGRRTAAAIVVLVVLLTLTPAVGARFGDLDEEVKDSGATGNSLVWRMGYWKQAIELAKEHPVTGVGPRMVAAATGGGKLPHNDYVRALAEEGLLGLASYTLLLASFVAVARRAWLRARPGLERAVASGFVGCTATLIVVSITDNVISQGVVLWYYAAFAAAASAVAHRNRAEATHVQLDLVRNADVDR